jgi:hypothetical protein
MTRRCESFFLWWRILLATSVVSFKERFGFPFESGLIDFFLLYLRKIEISRKSSNVLKNSFHLKDHEKLTKLPHSRLLLIQICNFEFSPIILDSFSIIISLLHSKSLIDRSSKLNNPSLNRSMSQNLISIIAIRHFLHSEIFLAIFHSIFLLLCTFSTLNFYFHWESWLTDASQ